MEIDALGISETWSYWDRPIRKSVLRTVTLPKELRSSICLVLQGVRRCGKSTLMQQMVQRYQLNPKHCAFLNLEDPRLTNVLTYQLLEHLIEQFRARHPRVKRLVYFLDEIQIVEGWQRWLRSKLDQPDGSIFIISGSNATLLSGELSTALTGRHLTVELFPFSLEEFKDLDPKATFERYLDEGGFPEPLQSEDGDRLRRQYFHDIVERDVRERLGARSSRPIRQVLQMAFETSGSEMSLRRIAGATGVSVETASGYLEAAENAYLLFGVPFFAFSERKRAHRNRKFYPVDSGLRRVVTTTTGADRGKALECATYIALRKRFEFVSYWRGKGEVDFVVEDGQRIVPVQVTWDVPLARHEAALEEFYEHFPQADESLIVTRDSFEALI